MKDGNYFNTGRSNGEIHGIGESTRDCASNIAEYNWIALWGGRGFCDRLVNFDNKLLTKTWTLLVVSVGCIIEFALCRTSENYPKCHRPSRERAAALISSHGMTSSGNASSSATRRSNSARCRSVRGNALASTQMLAQISSTSASLSSTFSRSMPKVLTDTLMMTSAKNMKLARLCGRCLRGYNVDNQRPPKAVCCI